MTPERSSEWRAREAILRAKGGRDYHENVIREVSKEIDTAIQEEREACAKVAEEHGKDISDMADKIEAKSDDEFIDKRTHSDMVASYAREVQECYCIAEAIRSRSLKGSSGVK